jgi:hypothetical protein
MGLGSRLVHLILALWVAMPWLFLVCFGVFLTAVVLTIGRLPSYSNPDPKHVAGLGPVHYLTMQMLIASTVSPLVVGATTLIGRVRGKAPASRAALLGHTLGVLLVAILIFGNVLGLSSWLFD